MKPAIIFYQKGSYPSSAHIHLFIEQAVRFCKSAEVFVITDVYHNKLPCATFPLSDYEDSAKEFERYYVHRSTNSKTMELICLQRWFVLAEFIKRHGIEKCFTPDSDVMLFCDMGKEIECFCDCDYTLTNVISPGSSIWNNPKVLQDFCIFTLDAYKNTDSVAYHNLAEIYKDMTAAKMMGGICDMTLWAQFHMYTSYKVREMAEVVDGAVFDPSYYMSHDGFEHNGVEKVFQWVAGLPYCSRGGKLVRFKSLHLTCRQHLAPEIFNKSTEAIA